MSDQELVTFLRSATSDLPDPVQPVTYDEVRRVARRTRAGRAAAGGVAFGAALIMVAAVWDPAGPPNESAAPPAPTESSPPVEAAVVECPSLADCPEAVFDMEEWSQAAQDRLHPFAQALYEAGEEHAGFADVGLTYEPPGLVLVWHGDLPDALDPVLDEALHAGITVYRVESKYGAAELEVAIEKVLDALIEADIPVKSIGIAPGYTGIQIAGPTLSVDAEMQQQATAVAAQAVGDIPITFAPYEEPLPD